MIIRIFRGIVRTGRHADFKKVLEILTLPNIKHRNGMVACYPGQPVETNSDEFVLITVWKDSAVKNFHSSTDWIKSIIPPEALPLLKNGMTRIINPSAFTKSRSNPSYRIYNLAPAIRLASRLGPIPGSPAYHPLKSPLEGIVFSAPGAYAGDRSDGYEPKPLSDPASHVSGTLPVLVA